MINNENLTASILKLWSHLAAKRRLQFKLLLILMMVASIAEMFTITAVLPFLGVIATPDIVFNNPYVKPVNDLLNLESSEDLKLFITIGFVIIALIAGAIRVILLSVSTKLLFAAGIDLSAEIYRRSLFQPYPIHVNRNSSDLINVVFNKSSDVIFGVMMPLMTIISSSILLVGIISVLVIIDPMVMLLTFTSFAILYFCILRITSQKVKHNSKLIAEESTKAIQCLQEGIGGIRDVLMANAQNYYFSIYKTAISNLRTSQGNNSIIGATPRFMVETLGIVLIACLALYLTGRDGGVVTAIPVLGALAIGAQRVLPTLQQCYSSVTAIKGVEYALRDVLYLLNQSVLEADVKEQSSNTILTRQLSLENVSFKYAPDLPYVLSNITIDICKGDRIGIVGTTGGGKSTLVDIVMGLLTPSEGVMVFDGEVINKGNVNMWQSCIAHVPQSIYLTDGTIEQNIGFGCEKSEIDSDRVIEAAKIAQLHDVIQGFSAQYKTMIGENGVLLSGGQRQRLGIARALYRKSSLIIFDEATSALDTDTEKKVMDGIGNLSEAKTLVMIAHRVSTLSNCNKIVKIDNGNLEIIDNYEDISS
jgi:ABC-type multidrug transport system fused ATPase/permease subunit